MEFSILENAIAGLEGAAIRFSADAINDANVRDSYTSNIKRVTAEVKEMVRAKKITVKDASEFCYETRNQILEEHRKYTSSTGLSFAEKHKKTPPKSDVLYDKYALKKFNLFSGHQRCSKKTQFITKLLRHLHETILSSPHQTKD